MEKIQSIRGMRSVLPEETPVWQWLENRIRNITSRYGYQEVRLPILEPVALFERAVGESTDIVSKEMYNFLDKSGEHITLRPEGTSGCVRTVIENNMCYNTTQRLWYQGPMFRYERPQKGRYRQFVQLDIEALGAQDAFVDLEVIDFSMELYRRLGLSNLQVVLNSVGCPKCRPVYRKALQEYLRPRFDELCDSCKSRFDRNPLRILDCKSPICKEITEGAPSVMDHLCDECKEHFEQLQRGLDKVGAVVKHDKRLVRGLDYYTKTAYEILSGDLGSQNAVCGGGRYDNLAEAIGGPHVPGVGFASGIERVILTMEAQGCSFGRKPENKVYVVAAEPDARLDAMNLMRTLRMNRISADMDYMGRAMKGQMKTAGASAEYACILGMSEVERGVVTLKDLKEGVQEELTVEQIVNKLK